MLDSQTVTCESLESRCCPSFLQTSWTLAVLCRLACLSSLHVWVKALGPCTKLIFAAAGEQRDVFPSIMFWHVLLSRIPVSNDDLIWNMLDSLTWRPNASDEFPKKLSNKHAWLTNRHLWVTWKHMLSVLPASIMNIGSVVLIAIFWVNALGPCTKLICTAAGEQREVFPSGSCFDMFCFPGFQYAMMILHGTC